MCKLDMIPGVTNMVGPFWPCSLKAIFIPSEFANRIGNGEGELSLDSVIFPNLFWLFLP
jgi:hypothetical protein